jgi:hypothetical protein
MNNAESLAREVHLARAQAAAHCDTTCEGDLSAERPLAIDSAAGQHVHDRAFDHARADDVRHRVVAGVLRDLGLPRSEFLTALVTFNVGVEAGQLSVIVLAFAAVAFWRSKGPAYRRFIVQPASLAIAFVGLYWTVQRAFGV